MNPCSPLDHPEISAALSWARQLGALKPRSLAPIDDVANALAEALEKPIGLSGPAMGRFCADDTVAIVVPDASRKAAVDRLLPELMRCLRARGISDTAISFFFALGVHRPATDAEQERILGEDMYRRFRARCYNHDAFNGDNLRYAGRTSRGTEVHLNRLACACDHLILTGSVVPHYFAGFGGGRKALVPGLAGADTIAHNHALNLHPTEPRLNPDVCIGRLDGNPVAEDLIEAARLHPPAFIVNTVLNAGGGIGGLFVGEMDAAHRAACGLARATFCVSIREQADLVVAAIHGAPNFIQSHKALVNAHAALKPGGRIVLIAPSPEGLGGAGYRRYLEMGHPEAVIAALRSRADINGQTALSSLQKGPKTILVTEMSREEAGLLGAEKADGLASALDRARAYFRARGTEHPTCYLMPEAGITVPLPGQA